MMNPQGRVDWNKNIWEALDHACDKGSVESEDVCK